MACKCYPVARCKNCPAFKRKYNTPGIVGTCTMPVPYDPPIDIHSGIIKKGRFPDFCRLEDIPRKAVK